jgi:GWxTD domain-containing protein
MKIFYSIISFLIFAQSFAQTQNVDIPLVGSGPLTFYLDHSSMLGKDNLTYAMFSLMIYADDLKLIDAKDGKSAQLKMTAEFTNLETEETIEREWKTEASFKSDDDPKTLVVYDKWSEMLVPGDYKISLTIKDEIGRKQSELKSNLRISSFAENNLSMSEIVFVNKSENNGEGLNKTAELNINSSRRYGLLNPNLSFYYEVYTPKEKLNKEYVLDYTIKDTEGNITKKLDNISISVDQPVKTIIHGIDISKLPSGVFGLTIDIKDNLGKPLFSSTRNFEVIQPDYFAKVPFLAEDISQKLENILEYLATPSELSIFKKLNSGGKASFVLQYFRNHDPNPSTPENEFLNEVISRFKFCNEKFSWGEKEGWQTERGRILIQNGKPDEVEYHNIVPDSKPYEIWYYRSEKQYFYVFGDLLGNGMYVLLSSNKEGEVLNNDWRKQLQSN